MLKACFFGSLSPKLAENILIRKQPGSYLVRQSDLDPNLLLLSIVGVGHDIKHVIVPELRGSSICSRSVMEKKLLDESEEVQKLFESFCCKYPVTPDSESQPSSFKVKTRPEDGELDRCIACTFESEDIKKVKKHRDNHRVGYCPNCDSYFPQKNLAYHIKKCSNVVTHKCDQKQCDYSSPHKWMVERHKKEVHCKPHPCQECGKSFSSPEQLQSHMKSHQPKKKVQCSECDLTFNNKMSKCRHMEKVHINPTITISTGFMRLAGQSLGDRYKHRGKKVHYCSHCSYKTNNKSHLQQHQRRHLDSAKKKIRPDRYKCVSTCTYQNNWRYKVKEHMKTCRKYLLTTDHYRPKGIISNERVCLIADALDISNRKIKYIMKEMSDIVGRELMDYNLRDALSQNLNSTSKFYYSKQIKFTDKKGEERTRSGRRKTSSSCSPSQRWPSSAPSGSSTLWLSERSSLPRQ